MQHQKWLIITAVLMIMVGLGIQPKAQGEVVDAPLVRVALDRGRDSVPVRVTQGTYSLIDQATGKQLGDVVSGALIVVAIQQNKLVVRWENQLAATSYIGPLLLASAASEGIFSFNNTRYRDGVEFRLQDGKIMVVNHILLEHYLYGVVGEEIGYNASLEALKAQAVASRSYALASLAPEQVCDLEKDTRSQVYVGYSAEQKPGWTRVQEAVDATSGQVLYYNGQLVRAYYHANAGGYTEASINVWNENQAYLQARPSPYDRYALDLLGNYDEWPGNTYYWELNMTRQQVQNKLATWGKAQGAKGAALQAIGPVEALITSNRQSDKDEPTLSGRVTSLSVVGADSSTTLWKEDIRQALGLKSTLFQLEFDSSLTIQDAAGQRVQASRGRDLWVVGSSGSTQPLDEGKAAYTILAREGKRQAPVVFTQMRVIGGGYGHGVGMSQWGARGLAAQAGYNYQQILKEYYGGINPEQLVIAPYRR